MLSLLAYSPQIPGLHKIHRRKHAVVRKLKFIIQVSIIQRGLKNATLKKRRLQKCSLWCVGAELCDYNSKS